MVKNENGDQYIAKTFIRDNGQKIIVCSGVSSRGDFGCWTEKNPSDVETPFSGEESVRFAHLMAYGWMNYAQTMEDSLREKALHDTRV